ncbi:MAG: flagellar basal body P-ring formation chaperone FlgA [Phycisphaerae bacterium]
MLIAVMVVLAAGPVLAEQSSETGTVRVYLPRIIQVDSENLTLGQISLIHGEDQTLKETVSKIELGRGPFPGENLAIRKATIVARMATAGLDLKRVTVSGAQSVTVSRNNQTITAGQIGTFAEEYLTGSNRLPANTSVTVAREGEDIVLSRGQKATLKAAVAKGAPAGFVRVTVRAMVGKKVAGETSVLFRVTYKVRQIVARQDIPRNAELTPDNCKVVTVDSPNPEGRFVSPFGKKVRQPVKASAKIGPGILVKPEAKVVIERNQKVIMEVSADLFTITAVGLAMEPGKPGQYIKVRNVDSTRIVTVKVMEDGSVRPIYKVKQ